MSIPTRIARLNSNGTTDTGFDPGSGLNASGHCICQLPDGRYLVGGSFTQMDGSPKNRLGVFKADGLVDPVALPANGDVRVIQKQADGKIILGGGFTTLAGISRNRLARLKPDLTLDPAFAPSFSGAVRALALQEDGKAIAGGFFSEVTGTARNNIARLFNDPASQSLAVVSTSRVIWLRGGSIPEIERVTFEIDTGSGYGALGGSVARIPGGWEVSGLSLSGSGNIRARAFPNDGHSQSLDEVVHTFDFTPVIRVSVGGDLLASGADVDFGVVQVGSSSDKTVVITNAGLSDLTLTGGTPVTKSGTNADQWAIVTQPASPVAPGGSTSFVLRFTPTSKDAKVATISIASDDAGSPFALDLVGDGMPGPGSMDEDYRVTFNAIAAVSSLACGSSQMTVGGLNMTSINGLNRKGFARVDYGGNVLSQTGAGANGYGVETIAQLPDGKWMIGGHFTSINGVTRNRLARLNADGSLDTSFNLPANSIVYSISVQDNGGVLVGGDFTTLGGVSRKGLARITSSGALDASWNPNVNGIVYSMAFQMDGKILVGGIFDSIAGVSRINIARLEIDGRLDASFDAGYTPTGGGVSAIWVDNQGGILTQYDSGLERLTLTGTEDGDFTNLARSVVTMALQADGKILVGCSHGSPLIVRLAADGTPDSSFVNAATGSPINAIALSPSGDIYAGGANIIIDGQSHKLVRLKNGLAGPVSVLSVVSSAEVKWERSGTAPEAQYTLFELSEDAGSTWTALGKGSRIAGGWRLSGVSLPVDGMIRGRARIGTGGRGSAFHDELLTFAGLAVPDLKAQFPLGTEIPDDGSIRFQGQIPGQSIMIELKLENTGFGNLTGLTVTPSTSTFVVTSLDLTTLAPGQIATAAVRFTPIGVQDHAAALNITSNVPGAKSTYQITLRGRGVAAPVVTTTTTSNLISTAAKLRGSVKPNHDETRVYFQYKRTNSSTWIQAPAIAFTGSGFITQSLEHDISGLTAASAYHYRIVAYNSVRNSADPVYGATVAFTTPA
ncbi:MAG: choice-of-anchor D domain-containing protein [Verrucomicrobiota bacterium]